MRPRPLDIDGPFGRFSSDLLHLELPDLPDQRRRDTVSFVCGRARQLPTPLRIGVTVVSAAAGVGQRFVGTSQTTAFLRSTGVPFVGELARLVRSLGFAFVWETWPDTTATGAPA